MSASGEVSMPDPEQSTIHQHQQEPWFRLATRCATEIRRRFGMPDQTTEDRMVRVFRSALRPRKRAGRRPNHLTVRATEMWRAGMQTRVAGRKRTPLRRYQRFLWQRIYREVFPDFPHLDNLTRQYRTSVLRRNVKAYLRRQGSKRPCGIDAITRMRARKPAAKAAPGARGRRD